MKILKVIHGYPMLYNAGSEVYSQTICHGLIKRGHEVQVFTREEDPFRADGDLRLDVDKDCPQIKVNLVNNPRHKDRYKLQIIDQRFEELILSYQPDIVHIGHLNHLSISLVYVAKKYKLPIVYTLHDYWLMCPRGQFMQMHSEDNNLWAACDGQENRKCAMQCYARYFSGSEDELEEDIAYWESWVDRRMNAVRSIVEEVDLFISPARYLKDRYEKDFGLDKSKSIYLDYGFDRSRMDVRNRETADPFTFGYIGTHIPAKGVHQLIAAFGSLEGEARLRIWGRQNGQNSRALKAMVDALPRDKKESVIWMTEYKNQEISKDVFSLCDAIVTPSVWVENSPLVIHEAQQAKVPVITANAGGMGEYVKHNENGLLFEHRSVEDLALQMQSLIDDPEYAKTLGNRGYLYSEDQQIPDIDQHIIDLEEQYLRIQNG